MSLKGYILSKGEIFKILTSIYSIDGEQKYLCKNLTSGRNCIIYECEIEKVSKYSNRLEKYEKDYIVGSCVSTGYIDTNAISATPLYNYYSDYYSTIRVPTPSYVTMYDDDDDCHVWGMEYLGGDYDD